MKLPLSLLLIGILLAPHAYCDDYDDEDYEDEDQPKAIIVPNTPQAKYEARMDALKSAVQIKRDGCKMRETGASPFCSRDLGLYENKARRVIEQQLKDDLAKEAAAR